MRRTEVLQQIRIMRFEELHDEWKKRRLTQEEAAGFLGCRIVHSGAKSTVTKKGE